MNAAINPASSSASKGMMRRIVQIMSYLVRSCVRVEDIINIAPGRNTLTQGHHAASRCDRRAKQRG